MGGIAATGRRSTDGDRANRVRCPRGAGTIPSMRRLMALLQSTRVYLALFTVPPAAMWIAAGDAGESGLGAAGPLLLVAHTLLVLVHATGFDSATMAAGGSPRLALSRDEDLFWPEVSSVMRWLAAAATVVVALLMVVSRPMGAVVVLVALGLVMGLTGGATGASRRFRLMFAEVLWPALMLIVPMMIVGALRTTAMVPGAVSVTMVFALALSVYVVLCEVRDQPLDAGQGVRTLATVAGRSVATVLLFLALAASILVATRAATMEYWHWSAPGVVALASLVCIWSLPSRNEDAAPAMWMLAAGYAALVSLTV